MPETSAKAFSTKLGSSVDDPYKKQAYVDPVVAEREQKAVGLSKLSVILVLISAVVAIAAVTNKTIKSEEYNDFRTQFESYASEIIAVSRENAHNSFKAIESFSTTISSYALDTEKTWPFVTIPHYQARANRLAEQVGANSATFATLVHEEDRVEFERKSQENIKSVYEDVIEYLGTNISADTYVRMTTDYINIRLNGTHFIEDKPGPWPVVWQFAPWFEQFPFVLGMYNLNNDPMIADAYETMIATGATTISVVNIRNLGKIESQIFQPIFEEVEGVEPAGQKKIVGVMWVVVDWLNYFSNLLPNGSNGIMVVLKASCGGIVVTYEVNGLDAELIGTDDFHDRKYDNMEISADFVALAEDVAVPEGRCVPELTLHIYPSDTLRDAFKTNKAFIYTTGVVAIFIFTTLIFAFYDYSVRRRQHKVMARVIKQDKIVSNLFPSAIKDRLYGRDEEAGGLDVYDDNVSGPVMADLFPSVTIFFADIAGFTAWSSLREPPQVFTLLESIYLEFDKIANQYGVFKIETVGDCYVAACGLPEVRSDHANVMGKYARECMHRVKDILHKLEVTLGPDTSDLEMRMGLNSGQVTAGVLRGERSRFQLFGDAVNTAARMESTSIKSRIQISDSTAILLRKHGKGKWIKPRDERVAVKGKGEMQTYWLETKSESAKREAGLKRAASNTSAEMTPILEREVSNEDDTELDENGLEDSVASGNELTKTERLVEWNVDILSKLLQQICAARNSSERLTKKVRQTEERIGKGSTVLEEFKEIITLPKIGLDDLARRSDPNSIELGNAVILQLRDYITKIASMYRDNSFHNFEHASHVTASVRKLLSRIVSLDQYGNGQRRNLEALDFVDLVGHSYGITSDPLTQFAVVFTAVIHDVDHPGVPNTQLVKEKVPIASKYKEKSVAEQNSVVLAWELLMRPEYEDLRACIYSNEDELKRFRQLVVNTLMATDICDKELQALRKARWAKAFSETPVDSTAGDDTNRKATIVIEHLIQASDVSHTMQHWQIYKQWNENFFMECYGAYCDGRGDSDPSIGWYKSEIGFFDFYIIPLAKKLESCGVFGVSSDEYLNYAEANREEWARKGESIVAGYLEKYHRLNDEQNE